MIKKFILGTLALITVSVFVFGRSAMHVACTAASDVRDAVRAEVPVEFELKRAQRMVEKLEPQIRRNMEIIAEQKVDLDAKRTEIAEKQVALEKQRRVIVAMRDDLATGETEFVHAGESYSVDAMQTDLERRFDAFTNAEKALSADRKIAAAGEKTLRANQEKLEAMLAARRDLKVQIAELEASLHAVQAEEALTAIEVDDSHLKRTRELINSIDRRISVRRQMMDEEARFTGLIPYGEEAASDRDIAAEIDQHFNGKTTSNAGPLTPGDAIASELANEL